MLFNKETGKYRHFQTAKHIPFPVLLRLLQFAEYHIFGKERKGVEDPLRVIDLNDELVIILHL